VDAAAEQLIGAPPDFGYGRTSWTRQGPAGQGPGQPVRQRPQRPWRVWGRAVPAPRRRPPL